MNDLKPFLIAIGALLLGAIYLISPIDLLPGLPIDDLIVAIGSIVTAVKQVEKGVREISSVGKIIAILLGLLIITLICCKIF